MLANKNIDDLLSVYSMRVVKAFFNHLGAWPAQELGQRGSMKVARLKQIFFLVMTILIMIQILAVLRHCRHHLELEVVGQCIMNFLIFCTSLQRYTIPLFPDFAKYLKKLLTEIHFYHFRTKSEYAMEVYKKADRVFNTILNIWLCEVSIGLFLTQAVYIYSNYKNGLFTTDTSSNASIYMQSLICTCVPLSYYSHLRYALSILIISYFYVIESFPILIYDILMILSISSLWGHIQILKNDLATFPRPKMEKEGRAGVWNPAWYSKEESVMVRERLVAMINHHKLMKEFSKESSEIFGMLLLCYYAVLQCCQIVIMLEFQNLTSSLFCKFGLAVLLSFQLLTVTSVALEILASESDKLWPEIYNLPWECMDVSNRRLVYFFMCNAQKNMGFKAKDILDVGVTTALSIIKTSFSTYLFLRSRQ